MFKEKLYRDALRLYAGQHVLDRVDKLGRKALVPGVELRQMTVLWTDLRGFTHISEEITPEQLRTAIGQHARRVEACIARHGGTVDSLVGDAVMAFWNDDDPAVNARRSLQCVEELIRTNPADNLLRFDIGVASGTMRLGNLGTPTRAKYTVMGDDVNLASRLVGRCAGYMVSSLVAEDTIRLAGATAAMEVAQVNVKGRTDMVRLYTLDPGYAELKKELAQSAESPGRE